MKRAVSIAALAAAASLALSSCGGSSGSGPPVVQTPVPAPKQPAPGPASATCPTTGAAPASIASSGSSAQSISRAPNVNAGGSSYIPGSVTVTYGNPSARGAIDAAAAALDARSGADVDLQSLNTHVRVYSVPLQNVEAAVAKLRQAPGVLSVERSQYRRLLSTVSVNDPYYVGFGAPAPYYETATVPGQWDMHVINVGAAWGYYASTPVRGAPIAILDTGVDASHPDLSGGKIVREYCYVTYPSSAAQTSGPYATDTDGHGTNVAGISDADTNNSFGFAGVAYDAPLLAYRIFPSTPSGGCIGSSNAQCSTTDTDEVSAIDDAISHGAKIINLSLGANGPLSNCRDTVEENAIESAISHGVVVVAASGNESKGSLDCPAAYPGVIAVGADGPAGSDNAEAVASYSNYTSAGGPGGGGAYLVAPGGTAVNDTDSNDLHFILNITSSQMADASAYCGIDRAGEQGDCRGGFAGTSQATPHVAGVVSLMLGLRPALTPAQIASDLCASAHSIGDSRQGCGRVDAAAAVARALKQ